MIDVTDDAEGAETVERDHAGPLSHATRPFLAPRTVGPDRAATLIRLMANIKSQKKRNRQNETRRTRNKTVRTELKTRVKTASTAVESGAENADELVRAAQKRLANAGSNGMIHKKAAARRTSRLMKRSAKTS